LPREGGDEIAAVHIALFVRRFRCSRSELLESRIIPERIEPVWTVGARGSNRDGFTISSGAELAYGTEVNFGKGGNSEPFRESGWSRTESQMTWTEGTAAVLAMRVSPTNEPVALKMKLAGLTKDPELPFQPVAVYVNDQKLADWQAHDPVLVG